MGASASVFSNSTAAGKVRDPVVDFCNYVVSTQQVDEDDEDDMKEFVDEMALLDPPINEAEADAIVRSIRSNPILSYVQLNGCFKKKNQTNSAAADNSREVSSGFTDRFVTELISVRHLSLIDVDLSDNNLTHIHARWIAEAMRTNPSLKKLCLDHNLLGDEGVKAIAEIAFDKQTSVSSLKSLSLIRNGVGRDGAAAIADALLRNKNTTFEHLYLNENTIGDVGCTTLGSFLLWKKNRLKGLYMTHCGISNVGATALAQGIQKSEVLDSLHIGYNDIGDDGCIHLALSMKHTRTLTTLVLCGNRITSKGAEALAVALTNNNYSVGILLCRDNDSDFTSRLEDRITALGHRNQNILNLFEHVTRGLPMQSAPARTSTTSSSPVSPLSVQPKLWPKVLERMRLKPDLLFATLKARPDITLAGQQQQQQQQASSTRSRRDDDDENVDRKLPRTARKRQRTGS